MPWALRQAREIHRPEHLSFLLADTIWAIGAGSLHQGPLLDAAQSFPDRDKRGFPEVAIGLALCRIQHGACVVGIVGVDSDHGRRDVLEGIDLSLLRYGLQESTAGT